MKLVIKEYLSSLNERDELDAILPDLLSQLGLTVFGKPIRGGKRKRRGCCRCWLFIWRS